jgi:hypothetical protein
MKATLIACSAAVFALTLALTPFRPVDEVLATSTWGAGTPSSTWITAFATFRPWWVKHRPEAVIVTPSGGIAHVVAVPRTEITTDEERLVLPIRGIGYDAFLGGVTSLRSLFSEEVIYDFALFVRLQRLLLAAVLALVPVGLFVLLPGTRTGMALVLFTAVYGALLVVRPNEEPHLSDGIIDSALASPLAVASTLALSLVARSLELASWKRLTALAVSSLFLGYCMLVRGELAFVVLFAFCCMYVAVAHGTRRRAAGLALAVTLALAPPLVYGAVNRAVLGHFVPLRMQSGQNLVEPIGQFPNPYGIEYRDEWVEDHLSRHGIEYVSVEADRFLTRWYLEILLEDPWLLIDHCRRRLASLSLRLTLGLNFWTIPLALAGALALSRRDPRFYVVAQPFFLAVGFLLFYGWFNGMTRLVAPVQFLLAIFVCSLAVYSGCELRRRRSSRRLAREFGTSRSQIRTNSVAGNGPS